MGMVCIGPQQSWAIRLLLHAVSPRPSLLFSYHEF